jgi:hypothetical protein
MKPVIGLDISKGESHGQAFLERGIPYRGTFQFEHTREGLAELLQTVHDVEHSLTSFLNILPCFTNSVVKQICPFVQ